MSDQQQSTFDPDLPLRETYAYLVRPEDRATLATLCASLLELTREAGMIVGKLDLGWPANIAAAAADLRYLAGWLAYTGAAEGDALEPWQRRFAYVAERAAPDVLAVAEMLERVIEEFAGVE